MNNGAGVSAFMRLTELIGSADCLSYCVRTPIAGHRAHWLSIYGIGATGEIIVEITDAKTTLLRSFISRHKNCPPEIRRRDLPLVDIADAFALARKMIRHWPRKSKRALSVGET